MTQTAPGRIVAIAAKSEKRGPMLELQEAEAEVDGGLTVGRPGSRKRGITLLAREQWEAATRELGVDLHWHNRRANVLVEGIDLGALIGRRIRLGTVELLIGGETTPCGLMNQQYPGLREALAPDCRAGVYGRVIRAGRFRVGDEVAVLEDAVSD